MKIKDKIYGEQEVADIIYEIIQTPEIQRLKGVYQGGSSFLVNKKWDVTRYDHSIGVMLLIKLLKGSIHEQIAGLLHDISHTAFSHVVDFALENKNENYHEVIFDQVVKKSTIPNILKKYGYDIEEILDEKKYTILERKAPKLCADRIDYTLRDMYHWGKINDLEISEFLNSLIVVNGEIMINSINMSEWFVDLYYKEVIDYFMHPLNVYGYNILSKSIKLGLDQGQIKEEDLLKKDEEVLALLKESNSQKIINLLSKLNENIVVEVNEKNYDIHHVGKLRTINPSVYINNKVFISSYVSSKVKQLNKDAVEKNEKGVFIKLKN